MASGGGLIAGALYLAAIPLINGAIINVRSFSLVFLLLALLDDRPLRRGVYAAISVLFSQVAVVALPILLYDGIRRSGSRVGYAARYAVSGLGVGALPFLATAVVWSPDVMVAGLRASFLSAGDYIVHHQDTSNPFVNPVSWAARLVNNAQNLGFVLLPAALALGVRCIRRRWGWDAELVAGVLAGLFFTTVLLKSLTYYWMPVVTFASVVVGAEIDRWFHSDSMLPPQSEE